MNWASHFEDDLEKMAANFAENLTGDEASYLLSKFGWRSDHTRIVYRQTPIQPMREPGARESAEARVVLKRFVKFVAQELRRQSGEITRLRAELQKVECEQSEDRANFAQFRERTHRNSNLPLEAENRRLRAEIAAKDRELDGLRKLTMNKLFGKDA